MNRLSLLGQSAVLFDSGEQAISQQGMIIAVETRDIKQVDRVLRYMISSHSVQLSVIERS